MDRVAAVPVVEDALAFWGLGRVGVTIKGPEGILYVGAYLTGSDGEGNAPGRVFPPPVCPEEVTNADAVLLTHDHTDPDTVLPIAKVSPQVRLVCPLTRQNTLAEAGLNEGRLSVPEVGEPMEVAGTSVTAVPSARTGLDRDPGRGRPYLGLVLEWKGVTVHQAGDSMVHCGLFEALGGRRVDGAFVPIVGREFFRAREGIVGGTDLREAAHLAEELPFGVVAPTHYDLLPSNGADPGWFVSYLYRLNPERRHKLLRPNGLRYFVKEGA